MNAFLALLLAIIAAPFAQLPSYESTSTRVASSSNLDRFDRAPELRLNDGSSQATEDGDTPDHSSTANVALPDGQHASAAPASSHHQEAPIMAGLPTKRELLL
jgi:hypothetical protein